MFFQNPLCLRSIVFFPVPVKSVAITTELFGMLLRIHSALRAAKVVRMKDDVYM